MNRGLRSQPEATHAKAIPFLPRPHLTTRDRACIMSLELFSQEPCIMGKHLAQHCSYLIKLIKAFYYSSSCWITNQNTVPRNRSVNTSETLEKPTCTVPVQRVLSPLRKSGYLLSLSLSLIPGIQSLEMSPELWHNAEALHVCIQPRLWD